MARQSTINVSLTPAFEAYVRNQVATGLYGSVSEVIRDSLRALQERERGSAGPAAGDRVKAKSPRRRAGIIESDEPSLSELASVRESIRQRNSRRTTREARSIEAAVKSYYEQNAADELSLCREWAQQDETWPR